MLNTVKRLDALVGQTPMLELERYCKNLSLKANILAKLEYFNPAGSVKDRVAKSMLDDAEAKGLLTKDTVIIEPTSGNTGIGLAFLSALRGYKIILTMPETMSIERRSLLKAYGATLVLTPADRGMNGAIEKAYELANQFDSAFIPSQFNNLANPATHKKTTGPEIWQQTAGKVDAFVAGVGTGGTVTGVGEYLKEQSPNIKVFVVEPDGSPVLSGGVAGKHKLQGIGAGFVPEILNTSIFDGIIKVSFENAVATVKKLVATEGLFCGISSGAALWAASELAQKKENNNKNIVVILPDGGERYLSTGLFG